MSRTSKAKSATDKQLIEIFDSWYAYKGYPDKVNYSDLERFSKKHGVNVSRTTFLRRESVQLHLEETLAKSEKNGTCGDGYRTLDISSILENFTKKNIREVLISLDNQNKLKSNAIGILRKENQRKDTEISILKKELEDTKNKLAQKSQRVEELIVVEKNLAELKRLYKQQEAALVDEFYNNLEEGGVVMDNVLFITEEIDMDAIKHEDKKSRFHIIKQELQGR